LQAEDIDFKKYWRGPVWINLNWLLYRGLLRYDMDKVAERVKQDSLALLSEQGFYEYFDPRKEAEGEIGCGTDSFSWSAALCVEWLMK